MSDEQSGPGSRDWLSTIVFTDIVEYSQRSLEQQIEIKDHFNSLISGAIREVIDTERVVVDAGDGIAICFLGDPEVAVVITLSLRNHLADATMAAPVPYTVRTGINLGPVRLVTDINGQYNVLGDGINVAQRVMAFSRPNQFLVARSFYDVAWCLSEKYTDLFRYYGMRKDKHGREHVLYELSDGEPISSPVSGPFVPEPTQDSFTRLLRDRLGNDVAPLSQTDWDPDQLRQVENDLLQYVGPLAKVLVRKAAARTMSVEDLYVRLARAIPAGERRMAFLEKASRVLEPGDRLPPTMPVESGASIRHARASSRLPREWPANMLETATRLLAPHVGPLAAMLVRKASRRCESLSDLYQQLAENIDDPKARKFFLSQAPDDAKPETR